MKSYEFLKENTSLSDTHADLENYMNLSPAEFLKMYGVSKQQWYSENQALVGKINQHHPHKAHSYIYFIPGEEPQLNQQLKRHFDTEQQAQQFLKFLSKQHYGVTMKKIN